MGKATDNVSDYIVYTDGGCANNPGGPGGVGVVAINTRTAHIREYSYGYRSTTNNRMEMMAVLTALQSIPVGCRVSLYSDSQYTLNCLQGTWERQKNLDLWDMIDREAKGKILDLHWVRGHKGDKYNERCDELATLAIKASRNWGIDDGYEKGYKEGKEDAPSHSEQLRKRLDKNKNGGAMGVNIKIPEGIMDVKPEISDFRIYAAEHGIKELCARNIRDFYLAGAPSFKAYMNLKTSGIDSVSRMNHGTLVEKCRDGRFAAKVISSHIEDQKDALSALRWHVRGLTIHDSIRKALVDAEVRENCAG